MLFFYSPTFFLPYPPNSRVWPDTCLHRKQKKHNETLNSQTHPFARNFNPNFFFAAFAKSKFWFILCKQRERRQKFTQWFVLICIIFLSPLCLIKKKLFQKRRSVLKPFEWNPFLHCEGVCAVVCLFFSIKSMDYLKLITKENLINSKSECENIWLSSWLSVGLLILFNFRIAILLCLLLHFPFEFAIFNVYYCCELYYWVG